MCTRRRRRRAGVRAARIRLRNYFLTGIVVAAPIGITIYLTWTFVHWVDSRVKPLIPHVYNPDNYLPFSVPGVGLLFAILIITLLGFLTANFVGRSVVGYGETLLDRMPLVRNLYRGLKQLFQTALSQTSRSFQKVAMVEYPTPGVWRVGFVATRAKGEIRSRAPGQGSALGLHPEHAERHRRLSHLRAAQERHDPRHDGRGGGEDDHLRWSRGAGSGQCRECGAAARDRAAFRSSGVGRPPQSLSLWHQFEFGG